MIAVKPTNFRSASRSCRGIIKRDLSSLGGLVSPLHPIRTAGCLIIGDEVLNGKIKDSNSLFFSNYCFKMGIDLKGVEIIGDNESQIIDSTRRMSKNFDMVVTSGGLGPTPDDITYGSIAKAFQLPLLYDVETDTRMATAFGINTSLETEKDRVCRIRMATLPSGPNTHIYRNNQTWVPVVGVYQKLFVLPGIPQLFQTLLNALSPHIEPCIADDNKHIRFFVTTMLNELQISAFLDSLQEKVRKSGRNIKIGSYPHVTVGKQSLSFLGKKRDYIFLRELVREAELSLKGREITLAEEQSYSYRYSV